MTWHNKIDNRHRETGSVIFLPPVQMKETSNSSILAVVRLYSVSFSIDTRSMHRSLHQSRALPHGLTTAVRSMSVSPALTCSSWKKVAVGHVTQ